MTRIDLNNFSFAIGDVRILHDVSLSFEAGELIALLGPSGSGKSTLLKQIIRLKEDDVVGYVPQDDVLHRSISVEKVLSYSAMLRLGLDEAEAVDKEVRRVLEAVDLLARRDVRVKSLSGGQRKRVSVAMELLAEPPLLFMDEPTSGLDPALEEQMMDLFRTITREDRITIVTTHATASLDRVDLVVMLAAGRVVFVGPPNEVTTFFDAPDLASVYRTLAKEGPATHLARFEASPQHRTYVRSRLP